MKMSKKAMEPMYSQSVRGTERSGMGFCFMEAFMDDLKVSSSVGNGTLVQMRKKSAAAREQNRGVFSGVFVKAV